MFYTWTKSYLIALAAGIVLFMSSTHASEWADEGKYDFSEIPVLEIKPDFNGVDAGSGSYIAEYPFSFNAPGAGNLNAVSIYNGRKETLSFSVFLTDQTYRPRDWESDNRYMQLKIGAVSTLFICPAESGECKSHVYIKDETRSIEQGILTRLNRYNFTYINKAGVLYEFYPAKEVELVDSWKYDCDLMPTDAMEPDEIRCNAAGYMSYAGVRKIKYPNGELLQYEPYSVISVENGETFATNAITSNLGYSLKIKTQVRDGTQRNTVPGGNWAESFSPFLDRQPGVYPDFKRTMSLFKGSQHLGTITNRTSTRDTPNTSNRKTMDIWQTDSIGRTYSARYQNGSIERCTNKRLDEYYTHDHTVYVPIWERSPGGVVTNIGYHMKNASTWWFERVAGDAESIPVRSVSRGGRTWAYDNVPWSRTLTAPDGSKRKVQFRPLTVQYPRYDVDLCPSGMVGTQLVESTDGINRTTSRLPYKFVTLSVTLPEGNGNHYDYDSRLNITKVANLSKSNSSLATRVLYQAKYPETCDNTNYRICNSPTWVRDAKGIQTDYTYYPEHGGLKTITEPSVNGVRPIKRYFYAAVNVGGSTLHKLDRIEYCTQGSSCSGTKHQKITTYRYISSNSFLPSSVTISSGDGRVSATTQFSYNAAGLRTKIIDSEGSATYYFYDAVGRKVGEISEDPDGTAALPRMATRTRFDDDDNPVLIETGTTSGTTESHLDAMVVTRSTEIDYDGLGNKIREEVRANNQTISVVQYTYDSLNRLMCTAQRMNFNSMPSNACYAGSPSEFGYDRITKNVYDAANQIIEIHKGYDTPLAQVYKKVSYTQNGKPEYITDANNNTARLQYDFFDRQTHWYFPNKNKGALTQSQSDYERYTYDMNDNRTSFRKRDGTVLTYSYDNLNRLTSKTVPNRSGLSTAHTQNVHYSYTNEGLEKNARFGSSSGRGISREYDVLGNLEFVLDNTNGYARRITYDHNSLGIRKAVTHPDGQKFAYSTDKLHRLKSITHPAAGTLATFGYDKNGALDWMSGGLYSDYTFDQSGRLTTLNHNLSGSANDNVYSLGYNPVSQVVSLATSNADYTPLPLDQQGTQSYSVNGLNQYTNVAGRSLSYDANGNLASDGKQKYIYDQENRLVKVTTMANALKAELWYDPLGRLSRAYNGASNTYFLYDGDELISEYAGSTTAPAQRYVHGLSIDDPVAWFSGSSVSAASKKHLRANHQGSIVAVTNSSGSLLDNPRYDVWGKPESDHSLRFGYTGQAWMREIGLWHYKARMYHPEIGRFLQTDPIGYADQMNLYAYVGNDPMNYVDPAGMTTCSADGKTCDASDNPPEVTVTQGNQETGDSSCGGGCTSMSGPEAQSYLNAMQQGRDAAGRGPRYKVGNAYPNRWAPGLSSEASALKGEIYANDQASYAGIAAAFTPILLLEAPGLTVLSMLSYFTLDSSPTPQGYIKSMAIGRFVGQGTNKLGKLSGSKAGAKIWGVNGVSLGAGVDSAVPGF